MTLKDDMEILHEVMKPILGVFKCKNSFYLPRVSKLIDSRVFKKLAVGEKKFLGGLFKIAYYTEIHLH